MKPSPFHGLLVIDKPSGMTSRDVVDRVQKCFPRGTRLGHTGTLDPLATGVLVLCIGQATRLAEYVQNMAKTYRAGLLLGARSDTDDADGTITAVPVERPPDRATVEEQLRVFLGEIDQVPPAFSAAKVTGRRAYDLARRGQEVSLQPRKVHIHTIDILAFDYPRLELEIRCGKGTYIRSLARDLGEQLGCGALIGTLRRTRVGPFEAVNGLGPDSDAGTARAHLLPLSAALAELPRVTLDADKVIRLRHGQAVPLSGAAVMAEQDRVAAFDSAGTLVGVAAVDHAQQLLRPEKVLSMEGRAD